MVGAEWDGLVADGGQYQLSAGQYLLSKPFTVFSLCAVYRLVFCGGQCHLLINWSLLGKPLAVFFHYRVTRQVAAFTVSTCTILLQDWRNET